MSTISALRQATLTPASSTNESERVAPSLDQVRSGLTVLKLGDRGEAVYDLRLLLNAWGIDPQLDVDHEPQQSLFDERVQSAVLAFQREVYERTTDPVAKKRLQPDRMVGAHTLTLLETAMPHASALPGIDEVTPTVVGAPAGNIEAPPLKLHDPFSAQAITGWVGNLNRRLSGIERNLEAQGYQRLTVERGDTLVEMLHAHYGPALAGIDAAGISALVDLVVGLNDLPSKDRLRPGDRILLPPVDKAQVAAGLEPARSGAAGTAQPASGLHTQPATAGPAPVQGSTGSEQPGLHVVVHGETLWTIAARYGTTVSELVEINGIRNASMVGVGDVLVLPTGLERDDDLRIESGLQRAPANDPGWRRPQDVDARRLRADAALLRRIDNETLWLARCIYSETKRPEEMELVAWTVRNRVENGYRGDTTYRGVVNEPYQFSAFNDGTSTERYYENLDVNDSPAKWREALAIAHFVRHAPRSLQPFPPNTMHFYSPQSMRGGRTPDWAAGRTPLRPNRSFQLNDRRFRFYAGIR